jgi:hypothetical protein
LRKPGFAVHGTGETVKSVVVEQLPVVVAIAVVTGLLWAAFAGTIDKLATATPATKSNAVFIAISSQIPGQLDATRAFCAAVIIPPIASGLHLKTSHCRF